MLCHLIFTTILRWVFLLYFLDARTLLKARHIINSISAFQGKERKENAITLNVDIKSHSHVSFWKVKMCVCVCVCGREQKVAFRIKEIWYLHSTDEEAKRKEFE